MTAPRRAPGRPRPPRALAAALALLLGPLLAAPRAAAAEYRLQPGDAIEIGITGRPELRQRLEIDLDGQVSVPLLGPMRVAGLPLSEVRRRLGEELPGRPLRDRAPDGREVETVIGPDEISVSVAAYRPVYVTGDVARPGEQAFRPGMTVRQAVALAGGYDLVRFRLANPVLEAADLKAQYDALRSELAAQQVRVARLRAELDGSDALAFDDAGAPLPGRLLDELAELARRRLEADRAEAEREKAYLQRVIEQTDRQIAALGEQRQKQEEGVRQQTADAAKTRELFERGLAPFSRVTDEQRSLLLSSDRLLQTIGQVAQAERLREGLGRDLQKVEEQRRLRVLAELQEAEAAAAAGRARLDGAAEKLVHVGALRSQLVAGRGGGPDLALVRKEGGGASRIPADEDAELMPGDVVEVALTEPDPLDLATR
jgi:polysaccharide export outer membrane protein